MSVIYYTNCDLSLHESSKTIIVNPMGERFYFVACEDQSSIYFNATLRLDEEGRYVIEGTQLLYNKHQGVSSSYEKLLCEHPAELIIKRTFLGLTWYKVNGVMKREVRSRYICKHNEYVIHERLEFLSHTCISEG